MITLVKSLLPKTINIHGRNMEHNLGFIVVEFFPIDSHW
jgi:hypothetical protein